MQIFVQVIRSLNMGSERQGLECTHNTGVQYWVVIA